MLMMFIHHFFTFPDWWLNGVNYPTIREYAHVFNEPFKICVPVFGFITGYFYYFNHSKTVKYSIRKITDLLIPYWGSLLILFLFAHFSYNKTLTPVDWIYELFAVKTHIMCFCWYVLFYMVFMILLPFVTKAMSKGIFIDLLICVIIIPLVLYYLNNTLTDPTYKFIAFLLWNYFPSVLIGYICANYNLFSRMSVSFNRISDNRVVKIILCLVLVFIIPLGRFFSPVFYVTFVAYTNPIAFAVLWDFVYAPLFIFGIATLCSLIQIDHSKSPLFQVGKYSMLMWFFSCIFFNESGRITQKLLYFPHFPVLVLIWGAVLCFIPSYLLDIAVKKLVGLKNKYLFGIEPKK